MASTQTWFSATTDIIGAPACTRCRAARCARDVAVDRRDELARDSASSLADPRRGAQHVWVLLDRDALRSDWFDAAARVRRAPDWAAA